MDIVTSGIGLELPVMHCLAIPFFKKIIFEGPIGFVPFVGSQIGHFTMSVTMVLMFVFMYRFSMNLGVVVIVMGKGKDPRGKWVAPFSPQQSPRARLKERQLFGGVLLSFVRPLSSLGTVLRIG